MTKEAVRNFCLSLPHASERVQWGYDLLFCIGEKMFAVTNLEPAELVTLSFKCTPETFGELIEREGVRPAKYLARYHWVDMMEPDAIRDAELRELLRQSHAMVYEKLPRKMKQELEGGGASAAGKTVAKKPAGTKTTPAKAGASKSGTTKSGIPTPSTAKPTASRKSSGTKASGRKSSGKN